MGNDYDGGEQNLDGFWIHKFRPGTFIWSPSPRVAITFIDQIRQAFHKRTNSAHVIIVPRLLWKKWQRHMHKLGVLILDIPTISGYVWPHEMHETLILIIYFPYLNRFLWQPRKKHLMVVVRRHLQGVIKKDRSLGGDVLSQLFHKRGEWMPLRSAICSSCYCVDPGLVFPLNKPLGDESMYYRRIRQDKRIYLVARKGDWILAPHQCEMFWVINLCGLCPDLGSLAYIQTLLVLHRTNLDIFWIRYT